MIDKKINLLNFIKGSILLIGAIGMLLIWPFQTITNTVLSSSDSEANQYTGPVLEGVSALQEFVPRFDYIKSIGVLVNKQEGQVTQGNLILVFSNSDFTQSVEKKIPISEIVEGVYSDISIELEVIPGQTYFYSITSFGSGGSGEEAPLLSYRTLSKAGASENGKLYYDGKLITNGSLACEYSYGTPLRLAQIATYYSFIIVLGILLWSILDKFIGEKFKVEKRYVDIAIRIIGSLCWIMLMVAGAYYLLIKKVFGGNNWDLGIYLVAMIFSSMIAYIVIWNNSIPFITSIVTNLRGKELVKEIVHKIPTGLQTFAFAFYFIRYAYYFNSGLNYGHYIGYCYMDIAFGIIVLVLFSRKEIFSIPNLIFTIIYGVFCVWWIDTNNYDYDTRTLYLLAMAALWIWGMVTIRTVINLFRRKVRKFCIPYAILVLGFFALIIIFKNTRQWPVLMVAMFVIFYLQKIDESKMGWIFRNLCNGAILSFYFYVGQSILYRPYHSIQFSRYPGPFSSVAIWGIYLLFAFCAIFTKHMVEYKKNNSIKHMSFSYVTMGICLSYIFMSVSRTALFGIAIMVVIILSLLAIFWFRKNMKTLVASVGGILLAFVLTFPGVFTVTRCLPAVVNKPMFFPYEEFDESIQVGDAKDSYRYMTFDHFLKISLNKLWATFQKTQVESDGVNNESGNSEQLENSNVEEVTSSEEVAKETSDIAPVSVQVEDKTSYNQASNGRLEIFKRYIERFNWTGHDSMLITVGGVTFSHAHNTFIQSAYDHGILTGIVFVILGIVSFFRSILYIKNKSETHLFTLLPAVVIIAFGIAGMTEWVFHPSIPIAFVFLLVQAPLLSKLERKQDDKSCKK